MVVKYEEALFLLIAVFGLPSLDLDALMADPTPLLAALPFLGLTYNWKKFEVSTLIKIFKSLGNSGMARCWRNSGLSCWIHPAAQSTLGEQHFCCE